MRGTGNREQVNTQHPTFNAQRSRAGQIWFGRLIGETKAGIVCSCHSASERSFDFAQDDSIEERRAELQSCDESRHSKGRKATEGATLYPPFLPNEASCNVGKCAFMWFGENGLRRLQKNDNWLRFLEFAMKVGTRRRTWTTWTRMDEMDGERREK